MALVQNHIICSTAPVATPPWLQHEVAKKRHAQYRISDFRNRSANRSTHTKVEMTGIKIHIFISSQCAGQLWQSYAGVLLIDQNNENPSSPFHR